MPHDLTIPPVQALTTTPDHPEVRQPTPSRPGSTRAAPSPYVNPALRFDAEIGLVVMEFRDEGGAVTATIPNERQMEAYRQHQAQVPGVKTDESRLADPARTQTDDQAIDADGG